MSRDWSSLASRLPSAVRLVVALALLTCPFWLFPHAGESTHVHTATEVTYENEPRTYLRAQGELARLDCYDLGELDRGCLLAAYVAQNGPITVNSTAFGYRYETGTEYVVVEDDMTDAPFYRRVVNQTETRVTYSLERVTPETILRNTSVAESDVSQEARRTIDGDTVRTHDRPLDAAGQVVRSDGSYYVVESSRHDPERSERSATVWRGIAFAVGLAMLHRR
ncbi:hypothetical protein [Halorussus salinisoli]|uniref:hypothetical protein n=1 Tax=Halorussus salinisoli TaxID=2558242 RepID=UPI0010C1BFEF|nr:hypothetical protein [Halorussus salinisoli]